MFAARQRITLCIVGLVALVGRAQDDDPPLKLHSVVLGGTRTSVTESWGTVYVTVENPDTVPRNARVSVFYPSQRDVQFSRDLWVPARSGMTAWLPIGPVPGERSTIGRELEILLYDRTGGQDRLLLPPGEDKVRRRALPYRRREATTALFIDVSADDPGALSRPDTPAGESLTFTHVIRQASALPEHVSVVADGALPPTPEAFDGIDQIFLAGNRLTHDSPGLEALRQWLQQGGRLWILLDLVDPAVVTRIFGDEVPFQIVDRVSLTTVTIDRTRDGSAAVPARDFERPVEFVRVIPSPAAQVQLTVNGWPASLVTSVGRGRVTITTLGARGWHRPRPPNTRSPYERRPDLPIAVQPLEDLAAEFRPRTGPPALSPDDLQPLLTEEIGYAIVNRETSSAILGGFVLALVGLWFGLRRSGRPELAGWVAPVAAVAAAVLFIVLGEGSRRAVPPTVATAEIVDAVPASGELTSNGLYAMYQPGSGPAVVGTADGALLDLDQEGLAGQTRRRVQTDQDAWHWESLSVPAGVRTGPFRYTAQTNGLRATAQFGPAGVEGKFTPGTYQNPADAVISSSGREFITARLNEGGAFAAGLDDMLPAGQFLPGTVLTDRQQRRQTLYRKLLTGKLPPHMEGRDLLLTWAEPHELPFTVPEGARTVGTALLVVPLEFERPAEGTAVTVPRAFVPFRRFADGSLIQPTLEAATAVDQRLRFQLPASVFPLTVERATLTLRIRAPARRLTLSGLADGQAVSIFDGDSPAEPLRLEIADQRLLRPDEQGGLHLTVAVGEASGSGDAKWAIESLGLDVVGRTAAKK